MPSIYFDNFRGFEKTYLDLKAINFMAGENSTGKTSVLKLLGILSSPGFWRYGEFGEGGTSLGGFEDIITTPRTSSKDYFELGVFDVEEKRGNSFSAFKFKFINSDNFPYLKELCFINGGINLQVITDGNFVKYRYNFQAKSKFSRNDFAKWVTNNSLEELAFFKTGLEYNTILALFDSVMTRVANENEDKKLGLEMNFNRSLFLSPIVWIDPIRAEPQRNYTTQGLIYNPKLSHSPSVLKEILLGENVREILNKFGSDSGLYDDLVIKDNSTGFELQISINEVPRNIVSVGFGVSQVLPVVIETIARHDNLWFALQSPESQLHPKAQAALGDFIFKCHVKDGQHFLVETHSDFLIDRMRLRINRAFREKSEVTKNMSQVIFFTRTKSGNQLHAIPINSDGSYPEDQPKEFRNFFIREQLDIISI